MPRNTIAVRILIASPSDVESERKLLYEVINRWNVANSRAVGIVLEPIRWETHTHPASGRPPQKIVNHQIVDDADAVVAVFWSRLGSPTTDAASGTVEEIDRLRARGKPAMVYFSLAALPQNHDSSEFARVQTYKKATGKNALYGEFKTLAELDRLFLGHLSQVAHEIADEIHAKPNETLAPVLNILSLNPLPAPRRVNASDETDVWRDVDYEDAFWGAIAIFRNDPIKGTSVPNISELRAQITFYEANGGEAQRVHYGTWLGDAYNRINLEVGDTRELLVAVDAETVENPSAVENTRSEYGHYSREGTKFKPLSRIVYDVKIRLFGKAKMTTQVFQEFHFNLDLTGKVPILRANWT
jgi:hypothetical protein